MAEYLPLRERAPMMVGVLWMFQAIAFILVGLRLYTRLVVVHAYGIDDHFFNFSVLGLLGYVTTMTVAARYGLGQQITNPFSEETARVLLLFVIGQTILMTAVVSIKISIACFLLRIVGHTNRVHRLAIVIPVVIMSLSVFIMTLLLWFSCTPVDYAWDITIPEGRCDAPLQFWSALVAGAMVVLVELWYASFPWYLIRGLQMPRREKILIGTSMSISYISAGCSVMRFVTLLQAREEDNSNVLVAIIDVLIWHAADVTTQLFCIAITVCRPLYKDWLYKVVDHIDSASNATPGLTQDSTYGARKAGDFVALRTIGGSEWKPASGSPASDKRHSFRNPNANIRRELVFQSDDTGAGPAASSRIARLSELEKGIS